VSHISIKRTHHSSTTEAKKVADKVAAKLEKDYQLKASWAGDVLSFARSGVQGTLAVTEREFHIEVKLGFLMVAFKSPIQNAIEENIDKLIKPVAAAKAAPVAKPAAVAKTEKKPALKAKK
jgi:putative polyhydroxyalkanoate system protein